MSAYVAFVPNDLVSTHICPSPCSEGKILHFCSHAITKMAATGITVKEVIETFCDPNIIMPNVKFTNAHNYAKDINGRKIKIGVKDDGEPYVVITVFYWK